MSQDSQANPLNPSKLAASKLVRFLSRFGFWISIPLIVFGSIFSNHGINTSLPNKVTSFEGFSAFILVVGLLILSIFSYRGIARRRLNRGHGKTIKSKGLSLLLTTMIITLVFGLISAPAASIRWKLDPAAKSHYDAQIAQQKIDLTAEAQSKKMATDAAAESKVKAEADAMAKKAAIEQAKQTLKDRAKSEQGDGTPLVHNFSEADVTSLNNIKADLNTYINVWSNYQAGNTPLYKLSMACDLLNADDSVLRVMRAPNSTLSGYLDEAGIFLQDAAEGCSKAISGGGALSGVAQSVLSARNSVSRLIAAI